MQGTSRSNTTSVAPRCPILSSSEMHFGVRNVAFQVQHQISLESDHNVDNHGTSSFTTENRGVGSKYHLMVESMLHHHVMRQDVFSRMEFSSTGQEKQQHPQQQQFSPLSFSLVDQANFPRITNDDVFCRSKQMREPSARVIPPFSYQVS